MSEEDRKQENLEGEKPAASEGSSAAEEGQRGSPNEPQRVEEKEEDNKDEEEVKDKSPAYGLLVAGVAIGVGLIAYVATLIAFSNDLSGTAAVAALGSLFTLIGTVAGAYFGIKRSSDAEDKANKRVDKAYRTATNAAGAMNPNDWKNR